MKTCLIRQPAGLGDIIFCQKIAHHYHELGYKIVWPVAKEYRWIEDRLTSPCNFVYEGDEFEYKEHYASRSQAPVFSDEFVFLPLQSAKRWCKDVKIMPAKYKLAKVDDFSDWKDYVSIIRHPKVEEKIFKLMIQDWCREDYIFVNEVFASPPNTQRRELPVHSTPDRPVMKSIFIDGVTLFDWAMVIENASEIHTVDTSFTFLIELLDLKTTNINLYSRIPKNTTYNETKFLWSKDWTYYD